MNVHLGSSPDGPVELPVATFLRHAVCLGSSGSGKTVAAKVVCEEFVRQGIPVIAVDPQGDIASLAIPADPAAVEARGVPAGRAEEFAKRAEVVIWTPASSVGVPLSVNPLEGLDRIPAAGEDRIRALSGVAANLTELLGYGLEADDGKAVSGFLHLVLDHVATQGVPIRTFSGLAAFLAEQPEGLALQTAPILDERRQQTLRRKIQLLSIGASQLLFQMGVPLSIPTLLGLDDTRTDGRTRVSVIYLNTLHGQVEKDFLLGQLAQSLYDWMLANPSETPQALFYIDEVAPFLPPVRKPACKDALTLLFKQARKYGVCCLLASQNPGDVDYRCLAQFSTWNLGRMMVRQDVEKVEKTIRSIAGDATEAVVGSLPRLEPGQFRLLSPDALGSAVPLRVRWLLTEHRTLDEEAVTAVVDPALKARLLTKVRPIEEEAAPVEPASGTEPPAEAVPGEKSLAEVLLDRLRHSRRAWTVKEIAADLGRGEAGVRKALDESADVVKEKGGRSNWYWAKGYDFYPDWGIVEPVQVAKLEIFENDACRAATAATSSLLGLVKKSFEDVQLEHLALWQAQFTATRSKGLLFWKELESRTEFIYFRARGTGDLLVAGKGGIRFVAATPEEPGEIRDLDDVCRFELKTPDEVDLRRKDLQQFLSQREMIQIAERKFPIRVEACRLVFLPYWLFHLAGENRSVTVDGVLGKVFEA